MTVRVIDIETTGIDPEVDAIIEIASVDVLADGRSPTSTPPWCGRHPGPAGGQRGAPPDRRGPRLRAAADERRPRPVQRRRRLRGAQRRL